ncbi:MAG: hypothetical protein ACK6C0_02880 [Betaproteobacteria bacterium]|jgi:hypothetical protein
MNLATLVSSLALVLLAHGAAAQTAPVPTPPVVEAPATGTTAANDAASKKAANDGIVGDPADAALVPLQRRETRVEQVREGNRVVEVIVTPALTQRSYFMFNREGQRPLSPGGDRPNLSTPQFFKFEF